MEEDNKKILEEEIPQSVQAHLNMLQGIIQRMSSNCTSCKTWCITLVSALMVITTEQDELNYTLIAFIPIILFFSLDAYYLSLEKRFRKEHDDFIKKIHEKNLKISDLFAINTESNKLDLFFKSTKSYSIWPFYSILSLMVLATKILS